MATSPRYGLADRHLELLGALAWGPLSTRQLVKLSQTWAEPFSNDRQLRSQMQRLARAGLVIARPFATLTSGNPENYYQLTPAGFRLLFGEVPPSSASLFKPIPLARQAHQRALMDFLVHTAVAAHRAGAELVDLHPENSLVLSTGLESIRPDAAFTLVVARRRYQYYLEIDNATAALAAARPRDTIGQKLRVYEAVQDQQPNERFRVLFVSVRPTPQRLANIRRLAASLAHNPQRTLCLTCTLDDYLAANVPLKLATWLDHRERPQLLLPSPADLAPTSYATALTPMAVESEPPPPVEQGWPLNFLFAITRPTLSRAVTVIARDWDVPRASAPDRRSPAREARKFAGGFYRDECCCCGVADCLIALDSLAHIEFDTPVAGVENCPKVGRPHRHATQNREFPATTTAVLIKLRWFVAPTPGLNRAIAAANDTPTCVTKSHSGNWPNDTS